MPQSRFYQILDDVDDSYQKKKDNLMEWDNKLPGS